MKIPQKYQIWIDARKRHHLSHMHVQMARELSLNPQKFGKIDNHEQERWKVPLPAFIEHLYFKRFKRAAPLDQMTIEQLVKDKQLKKTKRKAAKILKRSLESEVNPAVQV